MKLDVKGDTARRRDAGTALLFAALAGLFLAWSQGGVLFHWLDATLGHRPLNGARSWHYHLTSLDLGVIMKSDADVIVTEYSPNASPYEPWRPEDVQRMKTRADGSKRLVIAYLSIGEAESYRFYWRPEWTGDQVPGWYVVENCAWPRNYMVRFWHDGWQDIIYRGRDSFLKRIVDAGFDGIYLDRIDVFWEQLKERPTARADMIRFVTDIAETARRLRPGFIVIAQNAEDLLDDRAYRDVLDGLGKEDLLYGSKGTNRRNDESSIREALGYIRRLQRDSKPVIAVEYATDAGLIKAARAELIGYGMIPTSAHRSLDGLAPDAERPPSAIKYGTPEWIAEKCRDKPHW